MLQTPIGRLRLAGLVEGCSFLLLVLVAMPLKYFAGLPQTVMVVGWIHGLLFILFCITLLVAVTTARLPFKLAGLTFLAALLPFGPFIIDGRLKRADTELNDTGAAA